ncbi:hypothetical protein ACE5IS_01870 [Leptospira wolffii]|uniref:Uncharacterized protein n=1 Tax=Leptospira wolffii TaxID=409998 RepID=A0ABV5BKJ5_9LEPT|nr:hypothetical protein [Leptospira wolffii]
MYEIKIQIGEYMINGTVRPFFSAAGAILTLEGDITFGTATNTSRYVGTLLWWSPSSR